MRGPFPRGGVGAFYGSDALPYFGHATRCPRPHLKPTFAVRTGEHVAGYPLISQRVASYQVTEELSCLTHIVYECAVGLTLTDYEIPTTWAPYSLSNAVAAYSVRKSAPTTASQLIDFPIRSGLSHSGRDTPRRDTLAGLREVVQANPPGPRARRDKTRAAPHIHRLPAQRRNGASHADTAPLGQVPLRRNGADAHDRLLARAPHVEAPQEAAAPRYEMSARRRPEKGRRGEECLASGLGEGVGGDRGVRGGGGCGERGG